MKKLNSYLITLLLAANLLQSCGKIEEANAETSYQLVNLYGYQCITNYKSIWCE